MRWTPWSRTKLLRLALSPLELVVGGIATPASMLGQGSARRCPDRFHAHQTRDEYGLMTVALMYLESGSGTARPTYHPADLVLQSVTERRASAIWRPIFASRLPTVPDDWIRF